jgi:hypothetical protein
LRRRAAPRVQHDRLGGRLEQSRTDRGGTGAVVWVDDDAERTAVLMANSFPLGPVADAAVHRALDTAFCDAID